MFARSGRARRGLVALQALVMGLGCYLALVLPENVHHVLDEAGGSSVTGKVENLAIESSCS